MTYGSMQERILLNRTVDEAGCWLWDRAKTPKGYGKFSTSVSGVRSERLAHRASYEAFVGAVPAGLQLDHLCRNRACVNPEHLEPVTCRENLRRARSLPLVIDTGEGQCLAGHLYDAANTYVQPDGSRKCRACRRAADRRRRTVGSRATGIAVTP